MWIWPCGDARPCPEPAGASCVALSAHRPDCQAVGAMRGGHRGTRGLRRTLLGGKESQGELSQQGRQLDFMRGSRPGNTSGASRRRPGQQAGSGCRSRRELDVSGRMGVDSGMGVAAWLNYVEKLGVSGGRVGVVGWRYGRRGRHGEMGVVGVMAKWASRIS